MRLAHTFQVIAVRNSAPELQNNVGSRNYQLRLLSLVTHVILLPSDVSEIHFRIHLLFQTSRGIFLIVAFEEGCHNSNLPDEMTYLVSVFRSQAFISAPPSKYKSCKQFRSV